MYNALSMGLALLVSAWMFYRATGAAFNPYVLSTFLPLVFSMCHVGTCLLHYCLSASSSLFVSFSTVRRLFY